MYETIPAVASMLVDLIYAKNKQKTQIEDDENSAK